MLYYKTNLSEVISFKVLDLKRRGRILNLMTKNTLNSPVPISKEKKILESTPPVDIKYLSRFL